MPSRRSIYRLTVSKGGERIGFRFHRNLGQCGEDRRSLVLAGYDVAFESEVWPSNGGEWFELMRRWGEHGAALKHMTDERLRFGAELLATAAQGSSDD